MSAAKQSLRSAMVAHAPLYALVGHRVYWDAPDNARLPTAPFIVLQQISAAPRYTWGGHAQITNRYQATIVATDTAQAAAVFPALIGALQWFEDSSASIRQCRMEAMSTQRQQDADAVVWFVDFLVTEDLIQ